MIIKKFEEIVERFPGKAAIKTGNKSLTYFELNVNANQVAHAIADKTAGNVKTQQVALLFEYGSDMIVGLLGALKAGKTYVPLAPSYPGKRLLHILENSESYLILTDDQNLPLAQELSDYAETKIEVLNIAAIGAETPGTNNTQEASVEKIAYILYTSGSTGKPKGVYQTHRNVLYYAHHWIKRVSISENDRMSLFTAFTHDGAIPDIYAALLSGACLYPYDMKENGSVTDLATLLFNEKITIWHSTPTLFRYFAGAPNMNSHFPEIRRVLLGGEPLRAHDVELYKTYFPGASLVNVYGQTESTVSSLCFIGHQHTFDDLTLGEPLDETKIFLMDEDGEMVDEMGGGEIVVASDYVALGYWKDKENSEQVFLNDEQKGRLYRTGDMGRFTTQGDIKIMGRKDFQVKIRGFRIELGEIESELLRHYAIEEAVVIAKPDQNNDIYLYAYIVTNQTVSSEDLRDYLFSEIPDYMIPRYFIFMEKMPLTHSGKIDRQGLPEPEKLIDTRTTYVAPANEIEEKVAVIWQEVLKADKIGVNDNFIELGGHSLLVMSITAKIHRELNVELQLMDVFNNPTIKELSQFIMESKQTTFSAIEPVEKKEYYFLSSAQKRLYILKQMDPDNIAYNMPEIILLPAESDLPRIEKAFKNLIKRHESFRTSFHMISDAPVQRIHDYVEFEIDKTFATLDEITFKNFIHPFDLAKAPLLRVSLAKNIDGSYILLIDMHHIISDGVSNAILVKDYQAFYNQENISPLRLQYRDFSEWQNSEKENKTFKRHEEYWLKEFEGELPVLDLPNDYPRPIMKSFDGNKINFKVTSEETREFNAMAIKSGATAFMALTAIFNILLSKLSGQEEITIGTPIAGRQHADLGKIIGMFVNTLALKNYPAGDRTFKEFLADVKERLLMVFENQGYPFEELVDKLSVKRDTGRNPLFEVMFVWQNVDKNDSIENEENEFETGQQTQHAYPKEIEGTNQTVLFDLTLTAIERKNGLSFSFQYCTKIFKKETIERFIRYFKKILALVVNEPDIKLSRIEVISEEEKKQVLNDFNNTDALYPQDKTIHQLFKEQVERTPDRIAVIGSTAVETLPATSLQITYRQLNLQSDRLAGLLIEKSVLADNIVAIMMERSVEMIIGIFGTLKAGAAYLPINPEYPQERIDYMLKDSAARILINKSEIQNPKSETNSNETNSNDQNKNQHFGAAFVLNFENLNFDIVSNFEFRASNLSSSNLAYLLYTSGSTGRPKGVMIHHQAVVNRLNWMQQAYPINENDVLIQKTPITFDVSVWELFWWSFQGASLFLPAPGVEKNPEALVKAIEMHRVTTIHFVPSMLNVWLDYINNTLELKRLAGLKQVFCSGEALQIYQAVKFNKSLGETNLTRLVNLYGPTEACVDVSYFNCRTPAGQNLERVPIGRPIENTRLYIVSEESVLQPIGIAGELLIAGVGLARGYLNRPELSNQKFWEVQEPFFKKVPGHRRHRRLYKTGDLARWLPDGNIEFLGRRDQQIKVRGFRIELGEIETQLVGLPWINQAVVIPYQDKEGDKILCAYVVLNSGDSTLPASVTPSDAQHSTTVVDELRAYLLKSLPEYMVPPYFMILDKMPLTGNGKLDRRALPKPTIDAGGEYIGPRNEAEIGITYIVADILGIDHTKISVRANFFNIGLNSITILKLAHRISEEFRIDFPIGTLFTNPSVEGVVADMKKGYHPGASRRAVLLNRKKATRNLFLISGDGRAYIFKELAMLLEGHFNVYGILGRGIMDTGPLPETRQEIYEDLIHEIKRVQPEGPYILGGHCFGAIIVYELARILEERKEVVTKVVLLDEPALMVDIIIDYIIILRWFNKCRRAVEILHKTVKSIKTKLKKQKTNQYHAYDAYVVPENLDARRIEINQNYFRLFPTTESFYTRIIKAPVLIIKADSSAQSKDPRWAPETIARISKKSVQVVHTSGEHYNMFEAPYVPMLAKQLTDAI